MKYLFLFESYKKSESIIKKFGEKLTNSQLDFIEYIKGNVLPGYIGKLVELYVKDNKRNGFRFFNIIDKKNIDNSIFIDKYKDIRYDVFTWNDNSLGIIKDNKFESKRIIDNSVKNKIDFFINNIIEKI